MRLALLRTQSDVRLAALARDGSEAAFALIVERHRRAVLAACRRILPEARAEDASQQVFMAAWRALGRGDEVRDVRPWLLRIARNTSLNALRVQGYDYDELRDGLRVGAAPDEELERRDVIRQTLAGLAALPERQREVLLRSAVEGAPHADIARDLGLSEGATRQLMLRARTTLRAAASALTPWPLVVWAAQAGGGGAAAAGGAGAVAAKVGVAAVLAGGVAVGTPAIVEHDPRTPERRSAAAAMAAPAAVEKIAEKVPTPAATAAPTPRATAAPAPSPEARPQRTPRAEERRVSHRGPSGGGSSGPGPDEDEPDERDDSSGSSSGDAEPEDDATDNSGPGSTDSGTSGSESGSASSGSDDMPDEDELLDDHSGSDSESSGSGS